MSVPQMKEGPASMLRAMFAGFGSLLSVMDKVRAKPARRPPPTPKPPPQQPPPAPEDTAAPAPEATADPATVAAEAAAEPETAARPRGVSRTGDLGPSRAGSRGTGGLGRPETSSALPLANYDELSVASLRARLRNLSNDDLTAAHGLREGAPGPRRT